MMSGVARAAIAMAALCACNGALVVDSLARQVDLRDHAEKVKCTYVVRNDGKTAESSMLIAIPADRVENFSYAKVTSSRKKLSLKETDSIGPNGEKLYEVVFPSPLKPQKTRKLAVISGYMGILIPHPARIAQADKHYVKYTSGLYEMTPYKVLTQTTTIKLSTSNILSSTKTKPFSLKGDKLVYGPYENVEPYSTDSISLHFETQAEFATITELEREIKVCHWGGVVFSETYNLRNSGAKLKDVFSRIDYERFVKGSSFEDMSAKLPRNSYGIDYRDDIGNISTSNVRPTQKHVLFEMRPRYPMFGGWHVVFGLFYTVPLSQLVSSVTGTSSYVLNTTFSTPFEGVTVEKSTIKIVLPEGSSDIKWVTPFHIDSVDSEIKKTYLDLTGRPVLVLRASNLMRFHNQNFQVFYSYPNIMIHRGPLFVVIGFATLFAMVMLCSRLDLKIGKKERALVPKSKED